MCTPSGNSEFCFPSSLNVSLDFVSGNIETLRKHWDSQENKTHYFPLEHTLSVYYLLYKQKYKSDYLLYKQKYKSDYLLYKQKYKSDYLLYKQKYKSDYLLYKQKIQKWSFVT